MVNNYQEDEAKTKFSWKNMGRIFTFIKPYKKNLIFSFLLGIVSSVLLLLIPQILLYAIDVSFVNHNFMEILLLAFLILALVLLSSFLNKMKRDKMILVLDFASHDLKVAIFQKLQSLPNTFYDTKSHGKIYTRATQYPDDACIILCYVLVEVLLDIINLIFVVIFMLITHLPLSFISFGFSFILILFFLFLSPVKRKLQQHLNNKNSNINAYISESINGIRITQSFNREEKNEQILKGLEKERLDAQKKVLFVGNLNWSLTGIFNLVSMALIYYIGLRYFYPAVSIGVIFAIDSYSSRFWEPIEYLTTSYNDFMDASTYLERIFELLDEPLLIEDAPHAKEISIKGNVELRNVHFWYEENKVVLKGVNLKINKGEKVGFVGETGCGKSTILNLISRFYDVCEGEILIDGVNVRDFKLSSLRGQVSIMLQDNFLFARSVYDNLVLNKKTNLEEVIKVCKMLDIHEMIMSLEKGYQTILLNNGSNLSSGERQLICIARIMIQNPKILILDEATSNIDLITEKKIEKALDIVTKNRTTIMVAHRISTIKRCDKIVLIKNHMVEEVGTHAMLMKKKGAYYRLYKRQEIH